MIEDPRVWARLLQTFGAEIQVPAGGPYALPMVPAGGAAAAAGAATEARANATTASPAESTSSGVAVNASAASVELN